MSSSVSANPAAGDAAPSAQAAGLAQVAKAPGERQARRPRPGLALAVIAGCNAMIQLDDPIVNIALPGMRADLGLSTVAASWVLSAYLLVFGGLLLLGGRAGDLVGRRRVFLVGVALFTAAAGLRALAPTTEILVALRAVQGVGAALAAPSGLALLLSMFAEGTARKKAIAVCTAVGACSTAGGLLLAGALTSISSWRWVLLLNVPLGLAILLLGPRVLDETARNRGRFDVAGALLSAAGAAGLVYGLSRAADHAWSDPTVAGPLAGGVALMAVFVAVESRASQPIVMLRLFADRGRVLAYLATLAIPGSLIGAYFFLSQFFQQQSGWSALAAAGALLPVPVTMAVTATFAVRFERRLGPKRMMALGATALAAGNVWLSQLDAGDAYAPHVLPALLLLGTGMALSVIPPTVLATSGLRSDEAGAAASVLNAVQTMGGSLGIALLVTASADRGSFTDSMSVGFTTGAAFAAAALVAAVSIRSKSA
ncbi:MFS transporter [Streptomyces monticola]|uniref:MFS transporter n=1 Tax=Streptomyces monticola TaxID=2666263 RepID=A0ABW2JX20_9ACTN